nr:NADH dehydrogenase subunit 4L [Proechinophthirus fluctus]
MKSVLLLVLLLTVLKLYFSLSMLETIILLEWCNVTLLYFLVLTSIWETNMVNFILLFLTLMVSESVVGLSLVVNVNASFSYLSAELLSCSKF